MVKQLTPMPEAPKRALGREDYIDVADTWAEALVINTLERNEQQLEANALAVRAETAAAAAFSSPGASATSTTSLSIGTGSKTLTIQTGKAYSVGQGVVIANTADPDTQMRGRITAYNSGTGALTVNVISRTGSGTYSAWTISLGATPDIASTSEVRAGTSEALLTVKAVYDALAPVNIADGGTIAFNLAAGENFAWTIGGARTLPNPSNMVQRKKFEITVTTGVSGASLAFGSFYSFENDVLPAIAQAVGQRVVLFGEVMGSSEIFIYGSRTFKAAA
ncbi:hypothetical protein [uncultured Sphingomonas sp.]|uniref:hypothetical protein n=1 Tax=uncultured Sphingomonas sp. TaxID=158754 RepID=UPI0025F73F03|nr:hypothetical protein [uncultured Sphingomonas sp.]